MNRTQITFWSIIGLAALASTILFAVEPRVPPKPVARAAAAPGEAARSPQNTFAPRAVPVGEPVQITVASSVTKQKWMLAVSERFHADRMRTADGRLIRVVVQGVLSGGSMWKILDGKLKPTAWSPGAVSWSNQFAERWVQSGRGLAMSQSCRPTVYSPIGLAMWRPMAQALGWPDQPVSWRSIVELASDPKGWERYGHPEWGRLKIGHPHPKYSSAGMLFMASLLYGVVGKTSDLSAADVYSDAAERSMRTFAQVTTKYGMISTDLLRMMAERGPSYLHAVSAFEEGTVRLNLTRANQLRWPMVFIFPAEGTFWSSHPYCVLDKTDWVSAEQAEAANVFFDYLRHRDRQVMAVQHLLRPLDDDIEVTAPLSADNGADPGVRRDTVPALGAPNAEATAAIIDQFLSTKRKSTVYVMLDVSGSMRGEKIRAATSATTDFLKRLHAGDKVRFGAFAGGIDWLGETDLVSSQVEGLVRRVSGLYAGGGTALYDALCAAMRDVDGQRRADVARGDRRLYGIVVLSDGENTQGQTTENRMFSGCLPKSAETDGVKIFPIAFGSDADTQLLERIANVTGGRMVAADPESIERAYLRISAEQ